MCTSWLCPFKCSKVLSLTVLFESLYFGVVSGWLNCCDLQVAVLVTVFFGGVTFWFRSHFNRNWSWFFPLLLDTLTIAALTFSSLPGISCSTLPSFQNALEVESFLRMTMPPTVIEVRLPPTDLAVEFSRKLDPLSIAFWIIVPRGTMTLYASYGNDKIGFQVDHTISTMTRPRFFNGA